ncbi:MAG TPA: hypothetical protein PK306_05395 [Aquabacterium sp.]|jgi:hypothetical protein|uniref:Uncharacterized protein n=1 Tax=Piscinibacter sakaiensis TaxID=1547922 RepID=A0A0K8NV31_PISS1|nr:hypothetical protein [Piscinibacter sakaiensis]GAP34247.1 hypothetical protein ISF6_4026 [Piscinibacter sakaiensis]HOB95400.1 hypothetical protein [Aquabacterium sp.]HQC95122.1 hypothetical protein [Aquabacterium sp.]
MKSTHPLAALSLAAFLLGAGMPAAAGDGHDHGDAAPAAAGTALPRFAAVSETFELVGVLDGKQVTLYLDRFADNAPVRGAKIELEIAGAKFSAQAHGDDAYEVVLKEAPKPGVLPITATVTAGAEVDLLAGELDLHEAPHADEAVHEHSWKEYAGWAVGGLAALAVLVLGGRRLMAARQPQTGGAA